MTPKQAREKARTILGEIDAGQDPARVRDAVRSLPTLNELSERWFAEHVETKRRDSTGREYRRIVDKYISPALGRSRVDRVNRSDVMTLHHSLSESPYQANRVVAVLSALLTFAEKLEYRPLGSNPCKGVEKYAEKRRKRPLSSEKLSRLWRHLNQPAADENPWAIAALKLLILTGCRTAEILTLKWTDVDIERGQLNLRDAKNGDRKVILSTAAQQILLSVPKIQGNPFVICGQKPEAHLVNLRKPWLRVCLLADLNDARIHDLRHTVASLLARTAPMIVVRDALGHTQIETTSGYSHSADDDVRHAFEGFASFVAKCAA
jgi:integrase